MGVVISLALFVVCSPPSAKVDIVTEPPWLHVYVEREDGDGQLQLLGTGGIAGVIRPGLLRWHIGRTHGALTRTSTATLIHPGSDNHLRLTYRPTFTWAPAVGGTGLAAGLATLLGVLIAADSRRGRVFDRELDCCTTRDTALITGSSVVLVGSLLLMALTESAHEIEVARIAAR